MTAKFDHVFVLCTGRCGSLGFAKACGHFENYSAGHETRSHLLGFERLAYPQGHIEVDNRLAWLLGRVEAGFGERAFYVHLKRDPVQVAESYAKRSGWLIEAYHKRGIVMGCYEKDQVKVAFDMVQTIDANIQVFLRGKPHQMEINIETATEEFAPFMQRIGARGDVNAALKELTSRHNAS